jgi:endogenous inhibitor of DNA gyrase (YacG/DUF329 family)
MTKKPPCPVCGSPQSDADKPFCSRRCADLDLHRWLSGTYVIAGRADDDEDGLAGSDGASSAGKDTEN